MTMVIRIDKDVATLLEDIYESKKSRRIKNKYYYKAFKHVWIGIDNSKGEFLMAEFQRKKHCLAWLNGDFEYEDYYKWLEGQHVEPRK